MSTATQPVFAKDSWQNPRNARTLRAYMALQNQEIAGRIRELRGRRPQTVVAEALGVAERTYQNWEAGDAKPNYRSLQKLAEYYGVGEDYILTGMGNPTPVTNGTPDPFAGGETQLDRVERMLNEARDEQDRISGLIEQQNKLLQRQSGILDAIEELLATQQAAARRLEEMTQAAIDAMPEPASRAQRKARTGTSTGS